MTYFWLILLVAAILIEAATTTLVSIWFGAGALAALIAQLLGAPLWLQWVIFSVFTAVLLIFTRPIVKKLMPNKFTPTNADLHVGKTAVVIEEINGDLGTGRVRLNGVDWKAVNDSGEIIAADTVVTVAEVRGAKLAVKADLK